MRNLFSTLVLVTMFGSAAIACGSKDSTDTKAEGAAKGGNAEALDRWWTKTSGKQTLMDFRLGKDGTYEDAGKQKGKYEWAGKSIKVSIDGGPSWQYDDVSATATELKMKFMGEDYTFAPK